MVAWGPFWVSPRYCCFLFSTHVFVMDLSITFQYSWVIATVSFFHHQVAPSLGYSKFSDFNSTRISRCLHKFKFTALPCASSHLNMLCNMKILFYMLYNMFCLFLTCGSKSTAGGLTFRCKTSFQFEFKVTQPFYTIKKNRSSLIKLIGGVGSGDPRLVMLLQTPGCSSIIYWTPPFTLTPHAYRWQLHVINCVSFCPGSFPAFLSVSVSFAICLWHSDFGSGVTKPTKQQLLLLVVS